MMLNCAAALTGQTTVEKVAPTKAANGDGITYTLPKTSLIVNIEVIKTTVKAGVYYKYAERYLGVQNVPTEDRVYYELGRLTLHNKGVPDNENRYRIEFRQKTVAPFAYLTSDGLLCSINAEYTPEKPLESIESQRGSSSKSPSAQQTASVYTEELLLAGSVARQAEVAAKQIYHLRESRTDILTGDADNLPPDGEAMKLVISKLEEQEKELTQLFTGTIAKETLWYDVSLLPEDEVEGEVLFRFSSKLGVLDADDLGGEPVSISVKAIERAPALEPKEAEKKAKQLSRGIIYNVPGRARVEITRAGKSLLKSETPFVQFGTQEALAPAMLEDKKEPVKVIFYPETGAIKNITK
jgi:hypothetical protein